MQHERLTKCHSGDIENSFVAQFMDKSQHTQVILINKELIIESNERQLNFVLYILIIFTNTIA